MSNRDVWEPAVRPFFDAAMASIRVTAAVSWGKGERFWNAAGEVKPFENDAEVGLEGRLNQQLQTYPDPFHEMDIKYAKPKDTSRNTYVLVTRSLAKRRALLTIHSVAHGGHRARVGCFRFGVRNKST
jgi:hypothetical protein